MAAFERATTGLILWWGAQNALAAGAGAAVSVGRAGVDETADRIESDARAKGLKVLDRTDHAGGAGYSGFRIAPLQTLVLDDGTGGLTRVVVWQSSGGDTLVSAADRHGGGEPSAPPFEPGQYPAAAADASAQAT